MRKPRALARLLRLFESRDDRRAPAPSAHIPRTPLRAVAATCRRSTGPAAAGPPSGRRRCPAGRCGPCGTGHAFDVARQGHVHLAPGNRRLAGDTAEMVAARAAFLDAGHYAPVTPRSRDGRPRREPGPCRHRARRLDPGAAPRGPRPPAHWRAAPGSISGLGWGSRPDVSRRLDAQDRL